MQQVVIDLGAKFEPHVTQQVVDASSAKFKVVKAGRRWGKDRYGVNWAIDRYSILKKETRPRHLIPRIFGWVVGPSYPVLEQQWVEFKYFLPKEWVRRILEAEKRVELKDGSRFEFKSADDPHLLIGVGLDILVVVEAKQLPDEVWYRQLLPMLRSPSRSGFAYVSSTAKGPPDSWFDKLYVRGQDPEDTEVESWHYTVFDNPDAPRDLIEKDAEEMPDDVYRTEYLAEDVADAGSAFIPSAIDECACVQREEPEVGRRYVIGVDLGQAIDFTVLMIGDAQRRQVVEMKRFGQRDWTLQKTEILATSQRWNNARLIMDVSGPGKPIYDDLSKEGLIIKDVSMHDGAGKAKMYSDLRLAIEQGTLKFPPITELTRELKVLRRIPGYRYPKYHAAKGYHDDCPDALGLMLQGCDPPGGVRAIKGKRWAPMPSRSAYG